MLDIALLVGLGLLIGAVLGGLGGGGAVLAVPALVFLVGQSVQAATTSSLVVVGLSAAVGVVAHLNVAKDCCRIAWRTGVTLAATGVPAAWAGSYLNHRVDENVLLIGFALFMVAAAVAMSRERRPAARVTPVPAAHLSAGRTGDAVLVAEHAETGLTSRHPWWAVVVAGTGMGLLTGLFGAGGGFVILPLLVTVFALPVNVAAGTSLAVVALNSATALLARSSIAEFEWGVVVPFAVAAMAASFLARRVAVRLPARHLRRGFAVLLVLVAAYTGVQSALHLA